MKTTKLVVVMCLLISLVSCTKTHFINDEDYLRQVTQDYEAKERAMLQGDFFKAVHRLEMSTEEQEAMMFLYAYMPSSDVVDMSANYYLENVKLTFEALNTFDWGKTIPEDLVRHFVLPIRVNNENLDEARSVFFEELKDRVKGLSMHDAILEVNHWCHEKVVYRPSDARTSSPLASVQTAFGRCGEESTFTVAALRSVGIPARQVYTPRWAHTDDNHAWVEAWADGKWYFLGACEPEPVLNLGWFNSPASRGMLMHTKVFGKYTGKEEVMTENSNYTEINVIENYAPTAKAKVLVVDSTGAPIHGAKVEFKIYNYAEFFTVAEKFTNGEGFASLTAGKGDMLIWVSKANKFGFAKCSFGETEQLTITLDHSEGDTFDVEFDIIPPSENYNLPEVTPEQRAENDRRMALEDSIRNAYVDTFVSEEQAKEFAGKLDSLTDKDEQRVVKFLLGSRGNYETISTFLEDAQEDGELDLAIELLDVISAKDLRDVELDVLQDHLYNSYLPSKIKKEFYKEVLNPRVGNEMITAYKAFFQKNISEEDVIKYRENPLELVNWCNKEIMVFNELNAQRIIMSPIGVWNAKTTDDSSRDVFFVSVARSLGIPAWKDEVTGKIQYRNIETNAIYDVDFSSVEEIQIPKGRLTASYKPSKGLLDPKYYSHFSISKYNNGTYNLLSFDEGDLDMGDGVTWSNLLNRGVALDSGNYMLVTGTRMASGAVLSKMTFFTIHANRVTNVKLEMRQSSDDVQVIGSFNSESLYKPLNDDTAKSILQTTGRGYFVVAVLGVGQEPTNHAMRDISAVKEQLEKWGRSMVFLFPDEAKAEKFMSKKEFPNLPNTITYGIDVDQKIQNDIVKAMKLDKATLPVFIIADTFNRVVFVSQGYTIGLGEQMMKTIHNL